MKREEGQPERGPSVGIKGNIEKEGKEGEGGGKRGKVKGENSQQIRAGTVKLSN